MPLLDNDDKQLLRTDVLQEFKRRMPSKDSGANVSPFDDRVVTSHGDNLPACDLPEIHHEIRKLIQNTIEQVRDKVKTSQVILLAGDSGAGKTHLLRTFQSKTSSELYGYVYVGGSNDWSINEFKARLLDWIIEALTAPTPSGKMPDGHLPEKGDHLLLERVCAIGFRAVENLLGSPLWSHYLARSKGRWLTRMFGFVWRTSYKKMEGWTKNRDLKVFRYLDFARFSEYVCDRFLQDKSNLTHRFALRVLLTFLFPDRRDTGIGTNERILNWFRGRADDEYFVRHLGASEKLDRQYSLFDAVKLLVHLFSPAVSRQLSSETHPCEPRVFLLVFDQAEGRHELFDKKEDWKDFFAHLSELYNTLPNICVLFTMTLSLRKELHSEMERQFRDRIRMDDKFLLRLPDNEQVLDLYRSRIEFWLRNSPALLEKYRRLNEPCVPFEQEKLLEVAGHEAIRDTLQHFDEAFHAEMARLVVGPKYDYLYYRYELRTEEELAASEHAYISKHLERVHSLLTSAAWLMDDYNLSLKTIVEVKDFTPQTMFLQFTDLSDPTNWVGAYLAKLGMKNMQSQVDNAITLLAKKQKAKYSLWCVRAAEIAAQVDESRTDQVFLDVVPPKTESRLLGLLHVIGKKTVYEKNGQWAEAQALIREEIEGTYLGKLFRNARDQLDAGQMEEPVAQSASILQEAEDGNVS